ncbi:uncharacterized protein HfgLR_25285 (plasmid) [Haloferax gibbonsii]|uniref:Uncharacterized protein n=1 Tax=Haloferax gibbonsii TaxID=35746 RepID=A0A871BM95_HALGI|nr:uncharacterized protein HfgLR_25285 [Haloferax gibbonsii]
MASDCGLPATTHPVLPPETSERQLLFARGDFFEKSVL